MATSSQPRPENVRLRYGSAALFAQADVHSGELRRLEPSDPFTVVGTEGEFYRVSLPDGATGYVFAHNLSGENLPLTLREQAAEAERAATASQGAGGWRGALGRLFGSR